MKNRLLIAIFALLPAATHAQSDAIKNLERTTAKQTGEDFVKNALTLSDWLLNEGFAENAAGWAERAYDAAKKAKLGTYLPVSLNKQGTALLRTPTNKRSMSKAYKCFEESNSLTSDPELKADNLLKMRDLAKQLDRKKDLERIQNELTVLNGGQPVAELESGGLFSKRKKAEEAHKKALEQNQQLAAEVTNLAAEKSKLAAQQATLEKMVALKEAAIQHMSEAQMRQELLLSEKSRVVDSLKFAGAIDSLQLAQQTMLVEQQKSELEMKQAEIDLKNSQRNLFLAVGGLILILAGGLFYRSQVLSKHNALLSEKNHIIEQERKRSEELLLNILPSAIAEELKQNGVAEARKYDNATVLFTDFKGFSAIAKQLTAEQLVANLDFAFKNFDRIIGNFGLEKIKTIGDAYMCAGGLPEAGDHPRKVVQAALEIQKFLQEWNEQKRKAGEPVFEARIGIHTGPLVAGVVGSRKFAYDVWGDTVNVASRMESSGEPGKVNISSATYQHVKHDFQFEHRGSIPAKNVGEIEMYFVK